MARKKPVAFYIAFGGICICAFLAIMDTVVIANALPIIAVAFKATSWEAYWCGSGYLLAQTVVQPMVGSLSEVLGRKTCILVALSTFTLGSFFCATAANITWLILARTLQGCGSGGINVLVNVITADIVPLQERGAYMGMTSLSGAVGLVFGAIISSWLAEQYTWRLLFWINLPICVPTYLILSRYLQLKKPPGSPATQLKQYDWPGSAILLLSLLLTLYAITSGGVLHRWGSIKTISPLAYYISLRQSLFQASLSTLAGVGTVPPVAAVTGFLMGYLKRFKLLNIAAWVFLTMSMAAMSTWDVGTVRGFQIVCQLLYGIGGGILFPGRIYAVQASQNDEDVPIATTIVTFMTSLGEAFGVCIGGAVLQNRWYVLVSRKAAAGVISEDQVIHPQDVERVGDLIAGFPESVQGVYSEVMAQSIKGIWLVMCVFAVLGLAGSLLAENLSLDKEQQSKQNFMYEEVDNVNSLEERDDLESDSGGLERNVIPLTYRTGQTD